MAKPANDDLARAREVLTIFRVWEVAAREGAILSVDAVPMRDGLVKSPFRDDGRKGSFSICHGGRGFKDFGGDGGSGDVWAFAALCWPSLSPGELAKKYIDLSGITPAPKPARSTEGAAAPVDPMLAKAAQAIARRDRAREQVDAVYAERERQLEPKAEAKDVPEWPAFVRERYVDGWRVLKAAPAKMNDLAKSRGWPAEWVCELVSMGLLSYPLERWCEQSAQAIKRQKAFRVDAPEVVCAIENGETVWRAKLRPVGYHQRWFMLGRNGEASQKGWLYVPSVPKAPRGGAFEAALIDFGAKQGVTIDNLHGLVPALPFVLGDVGKARVIVILEGQWDAISFFGACGWFEDSNPPVGVAVFGIRGAQGVDVFLAYWAKWLRHNRPLAWVIADNDKAGQTWIKPPEGKPGMPRPPSFAERLEHAGCRQVIASTLKPGTWGKDFNDYYRAAKPTPPAMVAWAQSVNVMGKDGKWL